jgi:hypothetical protein
MFVGLHMMLADASGRPEWAITDDEGKNFVERAQNVLRHYSVEGTQKTLDWIAFGGCCVGMYGPRIVAVARNRAEETRANNATPVNNVAPFVPSVVQPDEFAAE